MPDNGGNVTYSTMPIGVPTTCPRANEESPMDIGDNASTQTSNINRRNDRRRDVNIASVSRAFEGDTPKIAGVVGLRIEDVDKRVPFEPFFAKLNIYIMKELMYG